MKLMKPVKLNEKAFRELLIEIAKDEVQGQRFNDLLFASGIELDDREWEFANQLLKKSDQLRGLMPINLSPH